MKKMKQSNDLEVIDEYDFSGSKRGKNANAMVREQILSFSLLMLLKYFRIPNP